MGGYPWRQQGGAIAVMIAAAMLVFFGFTAMVIDIGFGLVTRNQLQNIADGASLAGARQLGRIYTNLSYLEQPDYVLTAADRAAVIAEVLDVGQKNTAAGKAIGIETADIVIGQWNLATRSLTPTDVTPDAVQVLTRRDGTANGPITTFFARLFGVDTLAVSARATAALTGISKVLEGELDLPVGISLARVENEHCNQPIQFYPTNSEIGCAGWHTFTTSPANASTLRKILQGMQAGTYVTPEVEVEEGLVFIGGNVASALPDLRRLFLDRATLNNGRLEWPVFVVIYEMNDCSNPTGPIKIVGFASVVVTNVLAPPAGQLIEGEIVCELVEEARGGGADYGTKGSVPGLVQ